MFEIFKDREIVTEAALPYSRGIGDTTPGQIKGLRRIYDQMAANGVDWEMAKTEYEKTFTGKSRSRKCDMILYYPKLMEEFQKAISQKLSEITPQIA